MIVSQEKIMEILPHRSPFLFTQKVAVDFESKNGKSLVSLNELEAYWSDSSLTQYDTDYLILETAAQVFGITLSMLLDKQVDNDAKHLLLGFDDCQFAKSFKADQEIEIHVELIDVYGTKYIGEFVAHQSSMQVAKGKLTVMQEVVSNELN